MANGTQYFLNEEGQYEPMVPVVGTPESRGALNRYVARYNVADRIMDEQEAIEEAYSDVDKNVGIGGFLGSYALPMLATAAFPGLGAIASPALAALVKGVGSGAGTYLGGEIGKALSSKEKLEALEGKDMLFRGSAAKEAMRTIDDSLYATSLKSAIASGALDAFDTKGLLKDPTDKTVEIMELGDMPAPKSYSEGLGDYLKRTGPMEAPQITDIPASQKTSFFDRVGMGAKTGVNVVGGAGGAALAAGPYAAYKAGETVVEGAKGLAESLADTRMYRNVVMEDGTRQQIPLGDPRLAARRKTRADARKEFFENLKPRRIKPKTDVPRRSLKDMLGFELNEPAKRLFGKIGDAGRQMAANDPLVSAIKSGEWTQADLISFQEQYGLEPTGFMDMETASLLRGLE